MFNSSHDRGITWLFIILVLVLFAAAVMYFSRQNPELQTTPSPIVETPSRPARVYTVFYELGIFSPTNIRIHIGDSVKFQNNSDQPIHILSDSTNGIPDLAGFDSVGDIPPKGIFAFTFGKQGNFGYHNEKNPDETGTVTVRP